MEFSGVELFDSLSPSGEGFAIVSQPILYSTLASEQAAWKATQVTSKIELGGTREFKLPEPGRKPPGPGK